MKYNGYKKRKCNLDGNGSDFMQKEILQQNLMEMMTCCGQSVYYKEGQIIALQQDQTDCF